LATIETTGRQPAPDEPAAARPIAGMPYLALTVGVLCISTTAIFTRWAEMPGPVTAAWRMVIASAVLALPLLYRARRWTPAARRAVPWGLMGGLWFAVNLGMLNSALLLTSAATATLLDNTAPVWVGLGALLHLSQERLRAGLLGRTWRWRSAGAAVVTGFNFVVGFRLQGGDALAFVGALFLRRLPAQHAARPPQPRWSVLPVPRRSRSPPWSSSLACAAMGLPLTGYPLHSYAMMAAVALHRASGRLAAHQLRTGARNGICRGRRPAGAAGRDRPALRSHCSASRSPFRKVIGGGLLLTGIYLCLRAADR
jgi:hypothetical protein